MALIGESSVGKSALIKRLTTNTFSRCYSSTLEEFHSTTLKLSSNDQEDYILDIVDTAGLQEFRSALSASLKKKKDGYMFVYNDVISLKSIDLFISCIKNKRSKKVPLLLVYNKFARATCQND